MKLLFDQNISFRLIKKINAEYPQAYSLRVLGLNNATDFAIWNFAKENGLTIVPFDSDFFDFNTLYGSLPKIIWLRTGNMTTDYLAKFLISKKETISHFIDDETAGCLELIIDLA